MRGRVTPQSEQRTVPLEKETFAKVGETLL
jgi:hypothetical protein